MLQVKITFRLKFFNLHILVMLDSQFLLSRSPNLLGLGDKPEYNFDLHHRCLLCLTSAMQIDHFTVVGLVS